MKTTTTTRPTVRPAIFAVALFAILSAGRAQIAPPTPPAAREEVVALSPFIISTERETGWSANDILSTARLLLDSLDIKSKPSEPAPRRGPPVGSSITPFPAAPVSCFAACAWASTAAGATTISLASPTARK